MQEVGNTQEINTRGGNGNSLEDENQQNGTERQVPFWKREHPHVQAAVPLSEEPRRGSSLS